MLARFILSGTLLVIAAPALAASQLDLADCDRSIWTVGWLAAAIFPVTAPKPITTALPQATISA
jgi:hypothetical protein